MLKDEERKFPFSLTLKIINNGSVNHSGKSSEIFATKKKACGVAIFLLFLFYHDLSCKRKVQNITVLKSRELLKKLWNTICPCQFHRGDKKRTWSVSSLYRFYCSGLYNLIQSWKNLLGVANSSFAPMVVSLPLRLLTVGLERDS